MTLVYGNIRFTQILVGFPGDEASNDSGVIENVDFHGFRTLRLRHRYCYRRSSVRQSVYPSVCNADVPWAYTFDGWTSSKLRK